MVSKRKEGETRGGKKKKTGASLSNTRKARLLGEERERADETGGIGTCLSRGTGDSRAAWSRGAQVHRSAFVVAHNTLKKKAGIFFSTDMG